MTNKVLIIGIDGAMCSAMEVARTPNLDRLKSNGCHTVRAVTHPVTHSAACWSSMFTGVWGDKHLVNDPNNSFAGNNFANYPSFYRRLEAANSNWNTVCLARWSPLTTVVPDADVRQSFSTDAAITAETCRRLTNSNPDVLYMILLDVDSAGHASGWGPNVTNYVRAIETADSRVGQILGALQSRATFTQENWLIIALTDHGEHDHPDPERSQITWHIVSGTSAARGPIWPAPAIVDICATVLAHMGVPIDPRWNLDARIEGLPLPGPGFGTNLIFNGDAELISGTFYFATNRGIAWWFDLGATTIGTYGANPAFPHNASPGPPARGTNFFLGGTGNSGITQRIDVSSLAGDVDGPGVRFTLSGWFGGAGSDEDSAALTAAFLDSAGARLGSKTIGGVTAADRGGTTCLLERTADGDLPPGTRLVEFALTNHLVTGQNDATADNLSFALTSIADGPFAITVPRALEQGLAISVTLSHTNRSYVLERSPDLDAWFPATDAVAGTGGSLTLLDTNPPAPGGFYRVALRKD